MKLKKFFSLLLVAALFVGFTSCSDDDDDITVPSQVSGTWKFNNDITPIVTSSSSDVQAATQLILAGLVGEAGLPPFTITFNTDNTCVLTPTGGDPENGTYTYTNGKLVVSGDLSLLVLAGGAPSISFDVTLVSGNLVLELDMKPILGAMIDIEGVTKLAIAIKFNPAN